MSGELEENESWTNNALLIEIYRLAEAVKKGEDAEKRLHRIKYKCDPVQWTETRSYVIAIEPDYAEYIP